VGCIEGVDEGFIDPRSWTDADSDKRLVVAALDDLAENDLCVVVPESFARQDIADGLGQVVPVRFDRMWQALGLIALVQGEGKGKPKPKRALNGLVRLVPANLHGEQLAPILDLRLGRLADELPAILRLQDSEVSLVSCPDWLNVRNEVDPKRVAAHKLI